MLAVILNPLLYALRGTRNGITFITSKILRTSPRSFDDSDTKSGESYSGLSAKEKVMKKQLITKVVSWVKPLSLNK